MCAGMCVGLGHPGRGRACMGRLVESQSRAESGKDTWQREGRRDSGLVAMSPRWGRKMVYGWQGGHAVK